MFRSVELYKFEKAGPSEPFRKRVAEDIFQGWAV